ncbi:hypothetical protein C9374_012066 [Naegleria lovaniensis]|uniref:Uncharacterized protein n=1 Tax=Naegleria lovaniensis TaxID=51637 RepID=A0AA88KE41_NAELO|nr:uncharacterized protein C9374_012066 [Naegleria lovaniensis]KAG2373459.1 hypothetical protein C9374_012066 [Naegleria lovaniensis]
MHQSISSSSSTRGSSRNPRNMIQIQTQDIHDMFYELRRTEQQADEKFFVRMPKLIQAMQELAQEQYRVLSGYNYNAHVHDNPSIRNEIQTLRKQENRDLQRKLEIKQLSKQIKKDRKRMIKEEKEREQCLDKEDKHFDKSTSTTVKYRNGKKMENLGEHCEENGFRGDVEGVYHEVEFVKRGMAPPVLNEWPTKRELSAGDPQQQVDKNEFTPSSNLFEQHRRERKIRKTPNIYQAKSLSKKR